MMATYDTTSKLTIDAITGQIDVEEYICITRIVVEVLGFYPINLRNFLDTLDSSFDFEVEAYDSDGIEFGTFKRVDGRRVYPFEVNGYHFEFTLRDITELKKKHKIILYAK